MEIPGTGPISASEALEQVQNWLSIRTNQTLVSQLLAGGQCFYIGEDFNYNVFENQLAHTYFAIKSTPGEGGTVNLELALLFISEEDDIRLAHNETEVYIYRAPYMNEGPLLGMDPQVAQEMRDHWIENEQAWLEYMISESEGGLTLVSDVPTHDITSHFQEKDRLYVYFGLRNHSEPAENLSLLFYDGDSGNFLNLQADDFTTPKPPFGSGNSAAIYGLLQDYFNQ